MSPERTAAAFRPTSLGLADHRRDDDRLQAAGYAAGWAAGARAAADNAAAAERRRADAAAQAEARQEAAVRQVLGTLAQTAAAITRQQAPEVAEVHAAVQRAAIELAEAVLHRELLPGPDSARAILERAMALPADAGLHTVRVSPADLADVRALLDGRTLSLPDGVRLVADPALAAGDVISEHAGTVLDGRIRTALDRARAALEDVT
jgi:flagellar assembly protein FliH